LHGERGGRADAAHGEKDEDLYCGFLRLWLLRLCLVVLLL
jgi:hypothetical protein